MEYTSHFRWYLFFCNIFFPHLQPSRPSKLWKAFYSFSLLSPDSLSNRTVSNLTRSHFLFYGATMLFYKIDLPSVIGLHTTNPLLRIAVRYCCCCCWSSCCCIVQMLDLCVSLGSNMLWLKSAAKPKFRENNIPDCSWGKKKKPWPTCITLDCRYLLQV